jgi:hypothetical protein
LSQIRIHISAKDELTCYFVKSGYFVVENLQNMILEKRMSCVGNSQLVECCEKQVRMNSFEVEEDDVETLRTEFQSEISHPFFFLEA